MHKKGSEIAVDTRAIIIKLRGEGKTLREIGNIVKRTHSTIQRIVNNFEDTKSLHSKPRSGRPQLLSDRDKRYVVVKVRQNPKLSAPKISSDLENSIGKKVSPSTVRNVLRKEGFHGRVPRRKPLISPINRKKRLNFAKMHLNKDINFWQKVLFSDESKFNIFGSDGRTMVWRKPNQEYNIKNITPTVKHGGGSVMVWGCMAANGVGNLVFIESTMDRFKYLDILKENLNASAEKLELGPDYVFQQDNDPKHTANVVKEWLLHNVPNQLGSPPQSPDLNPIEHLWELLERRIRLHNIRTKCDLKQRLQEEWEKISFQDTSNLVNSMARRMQCVIASKGYPTKY